MRAIADRMARVTLIRARSDAEPRQSVQPPLGLHARACRAAGVACHFIAQTADPAEVGQEIGQLMADLAATSGMRSSRSTS
jgi:hypothetical protein